MARKMIVTEELTDDLDGSVATETIAFSFEGTSYEIDLNAKNAKKLRDALGPFVAGARKLAKSSRGRAAAKSSTKQDLGAVRAWAKEQGMKVNERGRISAEVLAAYESSK